MGWLDSIFNKRSPAQPTIRDRESQSSRTLVQPYTASRAFAKVEIFNRCVNMVVDSAAQVTYDVKEKYRFTAVGTVKPKDLDTLLNVRPNPYMDISTFRRLVAIDLMFEGVAYINWDGASLYHIPAVLMQVVADENNYINKFTFNGLVDFKPDEIIFIKDNAYIHGGSSQISGQSRLNTVLSSLDKREKMLQFKEKFLDNGTVIGLILETDEILNKKLKERKQEELKLDYNPRTGKQTVLILDGGLKAKPYSQINSFKDLDFAADIASFEENVCVATGVPSLLIKGGNNANIRPNIELLYYMTVLPMLAKLQSSLELFFGYKVKLSTDDVSALTPDREALTSSVVSLVNNGLITGNEGRERLRMPPIADERLNEIRIPVNVAGSATGLSGQEGGRPKEDSSTED